VNSAESAQANDWGALGRGLDLAPFGAMLEALLPSRVVAVNAALLRLLGSSRDELVGGAAGDTATGWCRTAEHDELLGAARLSGGTATRDLDWRRAAAPAVPCRVTVHLCAEPEGPRALWFVQDLSDEQVVARRESLAAANLSALIENTDDIIASYDRDIRLLVFNEACARIYRHLFGATLRPGLNTLELFPEEQRGQWRAWNERALSGEVFSIEFELPAPDGELRFFESSFNPIRRDGAVVGFSTFSRDITGRKRAEEERLRFEARLRQTQKMEAIGTLTGGLAHDFNNMLQVISVNAVLCLDQAGANGLLRESLTAIVDAADRGAEITRQLLRFSRPGSDALVPVELAVVVREALLLLRTSVATTIAIDFEPGPQRLHVRGDAGQLHQVLMNLGLNAAQSMLPAPGLLRLQLQTASLAEPAARDLDLAAGDYAQLSVIDEGHGMDEATLARIFDPFFSTRARDRNSGLGLTVVQGIVKGHGGAIRVRSQPGKGTRFDVFLPVSLEEADRPAPRVPQARRALSGRLMLVDDDVAVLDAMRWWLESVGFRVSRFARSSEAWAAFERAPADWDVVISDVVMPELSGVGLLERILALRPQVPVLLLSGFADDLTPARAQELGAFAYFTKPVDRDAALEVLARAVGG
jgi:PAS domain S-box-containing protein